MNDSEFYSSGRVFAQKVLHHFAEICNAYDHRALHDLLESLCPEFPKPYTQFLNGFLDTMEPTFKRTIHAAVDLALSRVVNNRQKNAREIVTSALRVAIIDDLRENLPMLEEES
jgi:hypothetical protein